MAPVKKIGSKSLLLKKKNLKRKSFKKKSAIIENRRGAVFFSNLPHGFYERALDGYLRQFGDIRRIKVAKSLKNAKPMGYAYVEFEHEKVALIVAKTMNKYLMFKKLLKCQFIKHKDLNFKMWANAEITPELCPGTIKKRRNQYLLASGSNEFYSIKKKVQGERMKKFLKNTLGLKMVDGNRNKKAKKIIMELEDSDEEISIKTPPNVVKFKKNKDCSNDARPVLCDGDATTIIKIVKKRKPTSMEPVAKELFTINSKKNGNGNKRMKLDSSNDVTMKVEKKNERNKSKIRQITKTVNDITKTDLDSSKPKTELSKKKSLRYGKLINNTNEVDEGTSVNKTHRKQRQTPKSLKKVIDNVPCSTNEENFTPKKRQRKLTIKSPASLVKNVNKANLESNKTISQRSNVTMSSQILSKDFNITPSLDSIEIKNTENLLMSLTPKSSKKDSKAVLKKVSPRLSSDIIKKTPKSLKKLTSANVLINQTSKDVFVKVLPRPSSNVCKKTPNSSKKPTLVDLLENKRPKLSKKGSKAVLGNISSRLSSDLIKNTLHSSKKLTSVNLLKNETPKPSKKDSKDVLVKVSPRSSSDISKKTPNSSKKLTSVNLLKNKTPKPSKKNSKDVLVKVSPRPSFDVSIKTPNSSKKLSSVNLLKNKTPKPSGKDSKAVLGKVSPRLSSNLINKTPNSSKKLTSVNLLNNKTPMPSKKDSKDVLVKVSPRPSFDVSKKTINSLRKLTPAPNVSKVVLMEINDKLGIKEKRSLNKSLIQLTNAQSMKNRRKSLGIKTAVDVKTPKGNRLRSKQKIHLAVSV